MQITFQYFVIFLLVSSDIVWCNIDENYDKNSDDYFERRVDLKYDALKKVHEFVYPKLYETVDTVNSLSNTRNITLNDILENSSEVGNVAETKHANFDFGSAEHGVRPNPNLLGLLCLVDPILLMTVLGFIVYLINTVLRLVERISLGGNLSTLMNPGSSGTPTSNILQRRNGLRESSFEWNGAVMKDLERILHLAINTYEEKYLPYREK